MKWYKFPVLDYRKIAADLPDAEDLAFRRLMDLYYLRQGPLPLDKEELVREIRLDWDCIEPVLNGFFAQTPDGWINDYLQTDVVRRIKRAQTNRRSGHRGGRPKKT
jgi:uncharacterized protein YdaU (DUF1376 family)